ncbi:MAG TPA: 4-alpha-glucanotransferase [Bryobacteraceae bacterium]|nr:4-alpha-glucanotransferase [Bryobacteraceae bacterium]
MGSDEKLLERAAAANGIELEYTDVFGQVHRATEAVTRALLEALGVPASTDAEIERGLEEQRIEEWSRVIDPVIVVREDAGAIRLRVPAPFSGASVKLEIEWENGELRHDWYWLPELEQWEAASAGGVDFIAKRLPLPALRLGYHRMRVYRMLESGLATLAEARFVVCPKRAKSVDRRRAGFGVSLYGVRSARNWGCGDFTDLHAIIDAFAPAGAAFIGLNPLHAIANRQPFNTSPYLPECSFYRNFIYLDVERVAEFEWGDDLRREIQNLRATEFVEYERVARLKLAVMTQIFENFPGSGEFDRYIEGEGQLLQDYAVYCALCEELHARYREIWLWTEWPQEYRDPRSEAVREFAKSHKKRVRFFQFLQWHLSKQAAKAHAYARAKGMEIGMYHDLALATDRYGCDLWAERPFYSTGCRVGAPPDDLAPQGQDWGFPPPNRDQHRDDGYRMFAQSIRQAAEAGGALRIDHVMRFFRLFWIPEAFPASQGTYVKDYADDLLGILALESVRGDFVVVGEDLGTVTGEVREALGAAGVLGYRLLWFEKDGAGNFKPPDQYTPQALASATTHDLPTLAGFRLARDIEARKAAGLIDESEYQAQKGAREEEVRRLDAALEQAGFAGDPLGFLLATPCALAMINYEDLSGELEQQNLPGSTWQHPNWRRKWRGTVEELGPLAERFRELVERSGRTGRH